MPILGFLAIHDLRSSLEGAGDKCQTAVVNGVSAIRRKIGDEHIETVVGSGYRFVG